jgi:acetolactate synthase-1/2/3 large subunit
MGLGAFPGNHRLSLGMLGMHGTRYANYAICECDCLIAVGARFDDRVTGKIEAFAPKAKVVHIDIDPAEIGKNVRVDVPIAGDVRMVLGELVPKIEANAAERAEWLAKIDEWKREYPLSYNQGEDCIKPQYVIEQIYEATQGEAIITTEVGQHQMWAAQHYKYVRPRSLVTSGGLGTMGFGLPAAIGAQIGMPDRLVFDISGDGSFQMNSQELATAVSYNLPIKVAILNNGYLGMVRQWQKLFYGGRYSQTDLEGLSPDFVKLAEAYGVTGIRVTRPEEVRPAIEQAIATPGPVLIDFVVDREENVYPMVPPGGCLDNMLGGCTE